MEENSDPNIAHGPHGLQALLDAMDDDFEERSPPRKKQILGIIILK
jgi:hypothetical protein